MSFSNTVLSATYSGDGTTKEFGVPFHYIKGDGVIGVRQFDVSDPDSPVEKSISAGVEYTIDESGYPNTKIVFSTAPASDQEISVFRDSKTIQPTNYVDFIFPPTTVERNFDRALHAVQENRKALEELGLFEYYIDPSKPSGKLFELVESIVLGQRTNALGLEEVTSGGAITPSVNSIVLLKTTSAVTVNLPSSSKGNRVVVVDGTGEFANKTIDGNGQTIVGQGSTYTLRGDFESKTFVSDGNSWYII